VSWSDDELRALEEELNELEHDDPAVADAAAAYRRVRGQIIDQPACGHRWKASGEHVCALPAHNGQHLCSCGASS
jgi:hypothetical protein